MMPIPPDALRISVLGFAIFGFFGVAYLRGNSLRSKVLYLLLLGVIISSVVLAWLSMASATIMTDMPEYMPGKQVNVLVKTFGRPYVGGVFQYQNGPYPTEKSSGFVFYRYDGTGWVELNTECRNCGFKECVDGRVVERYEDVLKQSCVELGGRPYEWDQMEYVLETRECNGEEYATLVKKPVASGRYKIELCYGKAFDFDWDALECMPFQNVEPTCLEAYFTVKDRIS